MSAVDEVTQFQRDRLKADEQSNRFREREVEARNIEAQTKLIQAQASKSEVPGMLLGAVIVALALIIIVLVVNVTNRLNNADGNNTQRNRIAACVQSTDVVGCLKAAEAQR